jgi:hypothetical protein
MKKATLCIILIICTLGLYAVTPTDSVVVNQVQETGQNKLEPLYPTFESFGLDMKVIPSKCPVSMTFLNNIISSYRDGISSGHFRPSTSSMMNMIKLYKEMDGETFDKLVTALSSIEKSTSSYIEEQNAIKEQNEKKIEEAENQKELAAQEEERKIDQAEYARRDALSAKYGRTGWVYGHTHLVRDCDYNEVKDYLIISKKSDTTWTVSGVIDDYVIYANRDTAQFALKREKDKEYTQGAPLNLSVCYKIIGVKSFNTILLKQIDLYILQEVGPQTGITQLD